MKKAKAKELLEYYRDEIDAMSLDERYENLKEFYCPDYYEVLDGKNENTVKSAMYEKIFIEKPDKVLLDYNDSTEAFLKYADINDAYNRLTKNTDYEEHSLEYNDITKYEEKRYGIKFAKFRAITEKLAKFGNLFWVIGILAVLLDFIFSANFFFQGDQEVFRFIMKYADDVLKVFWIIDLISAPIDKLKVIPWYIKRMIRQNVPDGDSMDNFMYGAIGAVIGIFHFRFNTHAGCKARVWRYKEDEDYQQYCRGVVDARYEQTVKDIKEFMVGERKERLNDTQKAFAYYNIYGGAEQANVSQSVFISVPGNEFMIKMLEIYKNKISEVEKEIRKEARRTTKKMARYEGKINYGRDRYSPIYTDSDFEDDCNKAQREFEYILEEKEREIMYLNKELRVIKTRIFIATATAAYCQKINA